MGESTDGLVLKHLQTLYSVGAIGGLSDGQLGDRVVNRRDEAAEAAFTILADRHGPMVLRVCRQMLSDRHEAEDAFQATFLVLASKAHSIRNRDSVAGWLHGVARRVALRAKADAARRRIKERRAALLAMAKSPMDDDGSPSESWPELHEEIARLPERYREPIVLCYLEGLTTEAASQRLGCPQGTILSRLSRARERLRMSLTRRGVVVPTGLLAAEWGADTALAVPTALLETTVRASLNFTARQAVGANLASTTAVGLAQGVLYAMTLSQWKTFGAATLACVLAMGSLRAFAQLGGTGATDQPPAVKPADDDRQAALSRAVRKLQAELDAANQKSAELQKQLQAIQAELKPPQEATSPPPAKETLPEVTPNREAARPSPSPRRKGGREMPLRAIPGFQTSPAGQYQHYAQDNTVLVVAPVGGKVKIHNARTHKTQSFQLSSAKDLKLEVVPIGGPAVTALLLDGSKITGIAASRAFDQPWVMQKLREPHDGRVTPIVGPNIAIYMIGRYIYGFSPKMNRWDVVEMPKEPETMATVGPGIASLKNDGHVYTFEDATGKWTDVDLRAIMDAPDDKEPSEPEVDPSHPARKSTRVRHDSRPNCSDQTRRVE
ncbi:sigma-70 family RNA polymerase sigma factor [Singulisphaera sp. Ch08]|uniref:Sigma-70 family RNA polymerase sigma factor n=1 Tax=Singulisphaera sp. Ch08 TaxID=3120278 RepID=A0AAU7CKS8_9BACT